MSFAHCRRALLAALCVCGASAALGQGGTRLPLIGFLCLIPCGETPIVAELAKLGYAKGKGADYVIRSADGDGVRLPALAHELVGLRPDVIVTQNGLPATQAAMRATAAIPIVFTTVGDPVASGVVRSLNKPGGNVTGMSFLAPELVRKQLEILVEAVPTAKRIAALRNPDNVADVRLAGDLTALAGTMGIAVEAFDVRNAADVEAAFAAMSRHRPGAVYVSYDGEMFKHQERIVALLAMHRLPAMTPAASFARRGALVSYGPNFAAMHARAAVYVDKILKGQRAGDLPVEQASTFDLIVNRETAKALDLKLPPSLLVRAETP